jgi:YHS domain-containing protein
MIPREAPPIPFPGGMSHGQGLETELEIVLDAVPIRPPLPSAVQFASYRDSSPAADSRPSNPIRPVSFVTSPSPEATLRVAQERVGANAPVCLEGYCPVELVHKTRWIKGDAAISAVYQGRTYLFSSEQAKRSFFEQPDKYAPAISGYDPVILLDENRLVEGRRSSGVYYKNGVYLFSSEATLKSSSSKRTSIRLLLKRSTTQWPQQSSIPF